MANFTPSQQDTLFQLAVEAATQAKEHAAEMATQAKELALKESEARIAAFTNGVLTPQSSVSTIEEDNDAIGELPLEARKVAAQYPGLPRKEIAAIFKGKFIPENLYKLRLMYGRDDVDRTTRFTIGLDGDLQFKRIKGTLKDFGSTTTIWSTGFLSYTSIMLDFFSSAVPTLHQKLYAYHYQIMELSTIYDWQEAVLPLTIEYHTEIVSVNHIDVEAWTIPRTWVDRFCSPLKIIRSGVATSTSSSSTQARFREPNDASMICRAFNGKGCIYSSCKRRHECSACGAKGHGMPGCKKQ